MGQDEKASAGGTAEAKGYDGDDVKSSQHCNANGDAKQQRSYAEQLFELFASDIPAHVETRDFSHIDEDGKHKFKKVETVHTVLSIEHVEAHLAGTVGVSGSFLQQNDTVRMGALDVDLYGATPKSSIDVSEFCERVTAIPLPLYLPNQVGRIAHCSYLRRVHCRRNNAEDYAGSTQEPGPSKQGSRQRPRRNLSQARNDIR